MSDDNQQPCGTSQMSDRNSSEDDFFTPEEGGASSEPPPALLLTQNNNMMSQQQTHHDSSESDSEASTDESYDSEIEEEEAVIDPELQAAFLRFHFSEINMQGRLYQCMKDEGWTYRDLDRTYIAPLLPGQTERLNFGHEKATRDKLDFDVTPYVTNKLQVPPQVKQVNLSKEERKYVPYLRANLIKRLYGVPNSFKKDVDGVASETRKDNEERDQLTNDKRTSSRTLRRSSRAAGVAGKENKSQGSTFTTFEKGADLLMRRPRGNKRARKMTDAAVPSSRSSRDDDEQSLSEEIAKLHFPTRSECVSIFRTEPIQHALDAEQNYERKFAEWKFLLTAQHSLLLYGAGSKLELLNSFAENELEKEGDVLTINGYDHEVDVESLLDVVETLFVGGDKETHGSAARHSVLCEGRIVGTAEPSILGADSTVRRAARISRNLASSARSHGQPVYLVVHNIDGPGLRSRIAQEALAALVVNSSVGYGVNGVRLVASIDHVNSVSVLWDVQTSANFSWIWKQVNTYRPYTEELDLAVVDERRNYNSKGRKTRSNDGEANVLVVLSSLAPRHAEVLQNLAKLQLKAPDSGSVDIKLLRDRCRSDMVIHNDQQLRAFLRELVDHGLVECGRTNGREWVQIPHSVNILHVILEYERS